jgi:hypothetical protein
LYAQQERSFVRECSLKSHLKQLDIFVKKQCTQLDHDIAKPSDEALYSDLSPSPCKPPKFGNLDLDQVPTCKQSLASSEPGMNHDSPMPKECPGSRSNLDSESCSLSSCYSEFAQNLTGELPPGWRCRQSRKWGRPFYYHSASGRSQWHLPTADSEHQSSTMC